MFEKMATGEVPGTQQGGNSSNASVNKPNFMTPAQQADHRIAQRDILMYDNSRGGAYSSETLNKLSPFASTFMKMMGVPLTYHGTRDVLPNIADRMNILDYARNMSSALTTHIPRADGYTSAMTAGAINGWRDYINGMDSNIP